MKFAQRYAAGDRAGVWEELVALGELVRLPEYLGDATAVARETMRRVRINVETVRQRLVAAGYEFQNPAGVHVPPDAAVASALNEIERRAGIMPLSLRAFYEIVGSVDFRQSWSQIVQWSNDRRGSASEVEILGEEDPVQVMPAADLLAEASDREELYFCFAADEFHKANYSGGENYHVTLPNPDADFMIEGMYGIEETFVEYLRATFQFGGFRGRVSCESEDVGRAHKDAPKLAVCRELARDLLPI